MNRWLVDASVLLAREDVEDANHADARWLLSGPGVVLTIDLAFYEVTNVAMVAWKDAEAARRAGNVIDVIADDGGLRGRAGRCWRTRPGSPGSMV